MLQHLRFKYACLHCERHAERTPVITVPMPARPLPGSNASAAMIATVTAIIRTTKEGGREKGATTLAGTIVEASGSR